VLIFIKKTKMKSSIWEMFGRVIGSLPVLFLSEKDARDQLYNKGWIGQQKSSAIFFSNSKC
jgi:hypothetical protein